MFERLEPLLSLAEDIVYFPLDYFESRWRRFAPRFAVFCLLLLAAYWPVLGGAMIWVDFDQVKNNILLKSARGLTAIWMHPSTMTAYHPLAATMLWIEYHLFGQHLAAGFHCVSLLLHGACAGLVWHFLRRLSVPGAWLGAAVFALHPVQVQSVAWISRQGSLWAALFFFLAILSCFRFYRLRPPPPEELSTLFTEQEDGTWATNVSGDFPPERRWLWYAISLALFFAALLTQITTAILPLVVLVALWWTRGRPRRNDLLALLPFAALSLFFIALHIGLDKLHGQPIEGGVTLSAADRFLIPPRAAVFYLVKLFWPHPLLFVYPRWHVSAGAAWQYLFPAAVAGIAIVLWVQRRRLERPLFRALVASLLLFLIFLLPFAGFFGIEWMRYSYVADQFQYLACLAPLSFAVGCLVLGATVQKWFSFDGARVARLGAGALLLLILGILTWRQSRTYADEQTLWERTLAYDPSSPTAHARLGAILLAHGKTDEAIAHFREAVAHDPTSVMAISDLGKAFELQMRLPEAIEQYNLALRIEPNNPDINASLAGVYVIQKDLAAAAEYYRRALASRSRDELLHNNLGLVLVRQGQLPEAIDQFQASITINPNLVAAHLHLSAALFTQGQLDRQRGRMLQGNDELSQAAEQLQTAKALDPNNFDVHMTAGAMLGSLNQYGAAEQMFRAAIHLNPRSAEAFNNLGLALVKEGNLSEAIYSFGRALDINPDYVEARENLHHAQKDRDASPGK